METQTTLGRLGPQDRIAFLCGACGWSRSYRASALRARLRDLGEEADDFRVERAAGRLAWPCPRCARMRWRSRVVAEATGGPELLSTDAKSGTAGKNRVSVR